MGTDFTQVEREAFVGWHINKGFLFIASLRSCGISLLMSLLSPLCRFRRAVP